MVYIYIFSGIVDRIISRIFKEGGWGYLTGRYTGDKCWMFDRPMGTVECLPPPSTGTSLLISMLYLTQGSLFRIAKKKGVLYRRPIICMYLFTQKFVYLFFNVYKKISFLWGGGHQIRMAIHFGWWVVWRERGRGGKGANVGFKWNGWKFRAQGCRMRPPIPEP